MIDPTLKYALIYMVWLICAAFVVVFSAKIIIRTLFKRVKSVNQDTGKIQAKNVKFVAHRGLSGIERENTFPAFIAAANRSYYGIETDIHKTADGEFVIIHDKDTDRVSLGKTKVDVAKKTSEQLRDIVLPDLDGSMNRSDIRIPFLTDYVKICKKYGKKCVLELKIPFEPKDLKEIVQQIKSQLYIEHVIFISFFLENCTELRKLLPDNDIQWLINGKATDDVIETLLKHKLNLDIYYRSLDKKSVNRLHEKGIMVNCWTCDNKEDAERLIDMGVDFITTNILEAAM